MKAHSRIWSFVTLILIVFSLLAACGGAETSQPTSPPKEQTATEISNEAGPTSPPPSIDGEALLQQRCTICHNLNRVTNKSWSQQQWEQIVSDMVRRGTQLNTEEKDVLVKYLAENYGP